MLFKTYTKIFPKNNSLQGHNSSKISLRIARETFVLSYMKSIWIGDEKLYICMTKKTFYQGTKITKNSPSEFYGQKFPIYGVRIQPITATRSTRIRTANYLSVGPDRTPLRVQRTGELNSRRTFVHLLCQWTLQSPADLYAGPIRR